MVQYYIYENCVRCDNSKGVEISSNGIFNPPLYVKGKQRGEYGINIEVRNSALASYLFMPAADNITKSITPANSDYSTERIFTSGTLYDTCTDDHINFSKTLKLFRVLGFMALVSYMVVILFTWMYANLDGYVYFSAGEPTLFIKYSEWVLGFTGIFVAIDCLRKEIKTT